MKMMPVKSISELYNLAKDDQYYEQLALLSAKNLGGHPIENLDQAIEWLRTNAIESDEEGVVDEINFCRKLVKKIKIKT